MLLCKRCTEVTPQGWNCPWFRISQAVCCTAMQLQWEQHINIIGGDTYSQMPWCCVQSGQCFHLSRSVVLVLCILMSDFELPPPGESSYWQTSGQACCSLQTGDSFSSHGFMQLLPAGSFYHKCLTVSFTSGLLFTPFPPVCLTFCLSSGPYCLFLPHTLKILLTEQSLSLCLVFVFTPLSLHVATIIICNTRFHIFLLV